MKKFEQQSKKESGYMIIRQNEDVTEFYTNQGQWTKSPAHRGIVIFRNPHLCELEAVWGYRLEDLDPTAKWVRGSKSVIYSIEIEG